MQDSIDAFLQHLRLSVRASEHTIRNYGNDLKTFVNFLSCSNHPIELHSITRQSIRSFMLHQSSLISKRSLARHLSSLRAFFRFCERSNLITENPTALIETPKLDKKIPATLTYPQVEHFLSLPDTSQYLGLRDRTIMELFYSSGLRLSELAGLNKEDIDLPELLVKVRGKGKKERLLPITQAAGNWLNTYLTHNDRKRSSKEHMAEQDHSAIFLNKFGKRLSTRSIDRLFSHYLTLSGLAQTITPHVIRHTIATHWLEHGMDIKTIQRLLGHSTMATTTIYTEVSSSLKRKTVESLHPRGSSRV
jgi:integrase/recombinase XerC